MDLRGYVSRLSSLLVGETGVFQRRRRATVEQRFLLCSGISAAGMTHRVAASSRERISKFAVSRIRPRQLARLAEARVPATLLSRFSPRAGGEVKARTDSSSFRRSAGEAFIFQDCSTAFAVGISCAEAPCNRRSYPFTSGGKLPALFLLQLGHVSLQ